ncbi:MAG: DUF58 domain-containing protein [Verrucomicrobiota bacterium]
MSLIPSSPPSAKDAAPGVYANLADLAALRFKASGFSFLPRQPVRSILAGRHASRLRGRGLNFDEIRRYLPGDDIRQMDWKVTARTRIPHTRVYTEEHGRPALLVVDQRLSMFFGSRKNFKSVTAAEVAALSAWRVIATKDTVGAVIFGDANLDVVPAGGSRGHVMRLLGILLRRNHALSIDAGVTPGPGMLNTALARAERIATHDHLVCLITDGIGHDEETRKRLSRIARHNDVLVIIVHDPLEVALPDAGSKVFGAGDLQLEINTGSRPLRDAFRSDFGKRLEDARHFLIQREVPVMPISTDEDVAFQVRRQLGQQIRQ